MTNEHSREAAAAQTTDYIDDLFDYDGGLDSMLQEISTHISSANEPKQRVPPNNPGVVLGLDEEVKVAKTRQPVAKLDENRLLTQAGIPKLRRSAKKNLKFKGKGHEFSDLARLLNFYQLWLDDLFPRAKFADGLAILERLGHAKRLQSMRREWINEEKPKPTEDETLNVDRPNDTGSGTSAAESTPNDILRLPRRSDSTDQDLFIPDSNPHQSTSEDHAPPDDEFDELDALLREHRDPDVGKAAAFSVSRGGVSLEEDGFDELSALSMGHEDELAAGSAKPTKTKAGTLEFESHAESSKPRRI
ncbi:replication fork protection component Swi3-domain-containing protein [Aspergillus crustosus]